jgi:hypothetical protein
VVEVVVERFEPALPEQGKLSRLRTDPPVRIALDIRRGSPFPRLWISPDIRTLRGRTFRRLWISRDIGILGGLVAIEKGISADICNLRRGFTGRISIGIGPIGYAPTLTAL